MCLVKEMQPAILEDLKFKTDMCVGSAFGKCSLLLHFSLPMLHKCRNNLRTKRLCYISYILLVLVLLLIFRGVLVYIYIYIWQSQTHTYTIFVIFTPIILFFNPRTNVEHLFFSTRGEYIFYES